MEIRELVDSKGMTLGDVVQLQLVRLAERIAAEQRMQTRLTELARRIAADGEPSADTMLEAIEEMTMMERYYTPEQLDQLAERRKLFTEEQMAAGAEEWNTLMAAVQAEMDKGTDPKAPEVQALARRWMEKVADFTGGDPGITASVSKMWNQESSIHGIDTGPVREMMTYIQRALAN